MSDRELVRRLEALRHLVLLETGCLAQAIRDRNNKPTHPKPDLKQEPLP
jgi:hypothetical protein